MAIDIAGSGVKCLYSYWLLLLVVECSAYTLTRSPRSAANVSRYPLSESMEQFLADFEGGRASRQTPPIPRLDPAPPGSILTYDGKVIPANAGSFSIVPQAEERTPSILKNRPQFATYRGVLPPPIPDNVSKDLPQFSSAKSAFSNLPDGFNL